MKKFLIFIGGFVTGILATFLVAFLINMKNQSNDGLQGLTVFPQKGECITTASEIDILQVLKPNMALATTVKYGEYGVRQYSDEIVVLLINHEGETYYDQQKINIPANKCARQIGTYQYTAKNNDVKTVPAVVIEQNNNIIESGKSFGNLPNTKFHYYDTNSSVNGIVSITETIEFGNGTYVFNSETDNTPGKTETKTEIGTFRVSGDSVNLTSSDGKEKTGIMVGSSLTIDGRTYR